MISSVLQVEKEGNALTINIQKEEDKIAVICDVEVIADSDVAALY